MMRNRWGGPQEGPRQVGGLSRRSGTGKGTLPKVRNGSWDSPRGPGWVLGPSERFRTGRGSVYEVRNRWEDCL